MLILDTIEPPCRPSCERGSVDSGLPRRSDQRSSADHRVAHIGLLHLWRPTGGRQEPRTGCRQQIITAAERLVTSPLRGESSDDLLPGLCHLALDRAVSWFRPGAGRVLWWSRPPR